MNWSMKTKELIRAAILFVHAALLAPIAALADSHGRDIVLVHGAWVGEWYWDDLVRDLQAAGHKAHAVTLKGHGQRASEGGSSVSIGDHAADIVAAITRLQMRDVILVGHSYGGRPVTAAWDLLRDDIAHVIYVESVAPVNDDHIAIPKDAQSMKFIMQRNPAWVEQGMIPVPEQLKQSYSDVLAPQSMRSVYGEVVLQNGSLPDTPGTYVVGKASRAKVFRSYGRHLEETRSWDFFEISGGHSLTGSGMRDLLAIISSVAENERVDGIVE